MSRNFELLEQIEKELSTPVENNGRLRNRVASCEMQMPERCAPESDESMVQLVQRVFMPKEGLAHRRVVFCGVEKDNGSSSVCARAGRTLAAHTAEKVCLVDAGNGSLASQFENVHELDGAGHRFEHCCHIAGNLWFAKLQTSKRPGPADFSKLRSRLEQLRQEFAYLLIEAPGCATTGDALTIAQLCDGAVLVVEANATRRVTAMKAKQDFEAGGAQLLGTVLHNRSFPIPKALYDRL